MHSAEDIEIQLWEYIDNVCDEPARKRIAQLIATDAVWQQKHTELTTFHTNLKRMEPEQASMRFSKNVMDSIAGISVARPAKNYINKWVIRSIAAVFILLLGFVLVYSLQGLQWSSKPSGKTVNYTDIFNNNFVWYVVLANLLVGVVLVDTLWRRKRLAPKD